MKVEEELVNMTSILTDGTENVRGCTFNRNTSQTSQKAEEYLVS